MNSTRKQAHLENDPLTETIIGAAIEVHRTLGPGLLESAYEHCLYHELKLRKIPVERQVPLPVTYKGVALDCSYRLDLLVDHQVVVELKTVDQFLPIHSAQLMSYLKMGGWKRGLLLNFHIDYLSKGGIKRISL